MAGHERMPLVGALTSSWTRRFRVQPDEINTELLRTGDWEGKLVNKKQDGSQIVVASRWSLLTDQQGHPTAILETNNDVTERKRTQGVSSAGPGKSCARQSRDAGGRDEDGVLRSVGLKSQAFTSAEEFLESGQQSDTVCLISDVQMPAMNGLELHTRRETIQ